MKTEFKLNCPNRKRVFLDLKLLGKFCAVYQQVFNIEPTPRSVLIRLPPPLYSYSTLIPFSLYEEPILELFPNGEAIFTLIPLTNSSELVTSPVINLVDEILWN